MGLAGFGAFAFAAFGDRDYISLLGALVVLRRTLLLPPRARNGVKHVSSFVGLASAIKSLDHDSILREFAFTYIL